MHGDPAHVINAQKVLNINQAIAHWKEQRLTIKVKEELLKEKTIKKSFTFFSIT